MKFFVSGKLGVEGDAKEVMAALKAAGHEITFDWTVAPYLRPYDENVEACQKASIMDIQGVKNADVLILLPHDRGVGMYVEFGAAIGFGIPIRVITSVESQEVIFHHPLVKQVSSIEEILKEFSKQKISDFGEHSNDTCPFPAARIKFGCDDCQLHPTCEVESGRRIVRMKAFEKWRNEQKISGRSYKADARVWRKALEWLRAVAVAIELESSGDGFDIVDLEREIRKELEDG